MKKEFFKDYLLSEEIKNVEILNSKIDYSYQEGKCNAFKIICKIRQKTLNNVENKDYEIELNNFEFDCEFKDQLRAEIVNINYLLTSFHLVIYGTIEVNQIERDEVSFTLDPFKKSLIDSFVEFKRNQQENESLNTDPRKVVQLEEIKGKLEGNLEKNDSLEIADINLNDEEMKKNPLEFLKDKDNVEIITTLSGKELENGFDLIKKDDQINIEDDHIIIEEPPIAVDKNIDEKKEPAIKEIETKNIENKSKKDEKEEIIKDNYVTSFFYYRLGKGETLTDVLVKYKITMAEFLKYNHEKDYKENSLVKIKKIK